MTYVELEQYYLFFFLKDVFFNFIFQRLESRNNSSGSHIDCGNEPFHRAHCSAGLFPRINVQQLLIRY